MSRILTFVSLLALGAALVGGAVAQTATDTSEHQGHRGGMRFENLDTNKDGALDKSEAKGRLAKHFDEMDANKDGKVTQDEIKASWQARGAERQAKRLARIDTDQDGKISWAEAQAKAKARFDQADANKDGVLDSSEMSQHRRGWRHHDKDMAAQ